ncbi:hypothetical protein ACE939_02540 [Aquimarina sp. W85]|uniref:DUF6913 domain-containing protein n=1 Tax=Aquimarina rhodophyticola TaxID=3342246 RepID=UPI00367112B0
MSSNFYLMILKGLKRNALKRIIEAQLTNRNVQQVSQIKSIAILVESEFLDEIPNFKKFSKEIGVGVEDFHIIEYQSNNKESGSLHSKVWYTDKAFTYKGLLIEEDLKKRVDHSYDLLINFYNTDILELNYIASLSKAKFKIGFSEVDSRINDLSIGTSINEVTIFIEELKKYLKILQLI